MTLKGFMARGASELGMTGVVGITDELPKAAPVPVTAPAPRTVSPTTSVDASSELEGRLRCKQTLRIDGCIKGEVECEKAVLIGECARVIANITADEVQIAGTVEGDITARRKITLERSAVVLGNLTTPGIVIEEGAKLKGRILIGNDAVETQSASDAKKAKAFEKRPAAAAAKPGDAVAGQPVATSA